jgi:hypothetical protein
MSSIERACYYEPMKDAKFQRNQVTRAIFFSACMFLMGTLTIRNLPSSQLSRTFDGWYNHVTEPLGLYENGWSMFAGTTTNTFIVKITRTFNDGTSTVETPFPLRSHWMRSVWNEAMEKIAVTGAYVNDYNGAYRQAFMQYECTKEQHTTPLREIKIERANLDVRQLYVSGGQLPPTTTYQIVGDLRCST